MMTDLQHSTNLWRLRRFTAGPRIEASDGRAYPTSVRHCKKKTDAVEGAREELERRRSGASYRDRDHQGARAVFAT